MKAKRTAKSIQPIPISAETSRLYVTSHGSSPTNGCWSRQANLQIQDTGYEVMVVCRFCRSPHKRQKIRIAASPNQGYKVAAWRRCFFFVIRRWKRTKPKAKRPKTRAYSLGSAMILLTSGWPTTNHGLLPPATKLRRLGGVVSFGGGDERRQNLAQRGQRQGRIPPAQG